MRNVALMMMAIPAVVYADSTPTSLDQVSVTATREEEKTLTVPASIGVKGASEIALDAPAYQKELLNSIPGVRITQTGSTVGHMTSIRMPQNTGPYYLFLQDSIPVQSSGFFNHNGLAYTNFGSAGGAEVLKGAGTALYGSDAVAATINVRSSDPSMKDGWSVQPEVGSDNWGKVRISGGVELAEDSSFGIDISHSQSDGWRDHTEHSRDEVNLTHFKALGEDDTLKTIFSANQTDAEMAGSLIGLDELNNNPTSVGDIEGQLDKGLDVERKFDFARLSTEWDHYISDNKHLSSIAYLRSNRNRYVATWEQNLPQNDSKQKTLGALFKMNLENGALNTNLGLDAEYTQAEQRYTQSYDYVPSSRWGSPVTTGEIYNYDVNYTAVAPYARLEYDVNDSVQINAGLRYDTNRYDYTNNLEDGQYGQSNYSRVSSDKDYTFHHLSPKLGVSFNLGEDRMAYLRYANGFRIPQATRLYSVRTDNVDFELDPEITDTYEMGYKFGSASTVFDVAVYQMYIDDTIVRRENAAGDRYYVNGGKTSHQGIELGLTQQLSETVSAKFALSYSKHEYVNDIEYGDNEQAGAPSTSANLRLFYKPKAIQGLTTLFEMVYLGDYWLDDNNTKTYDGYDLYNFKISYKPGKNWSWYAKVNNITDEIYAESASFSYGKEKYTPGAPRQFYVGFEYNFN